MVFSPEKKHPYPLTGHHKCRNEKQSSGTEIHHNFRNSNL